MYTDGCIKLPLTLPVKKLLGLNVIQWRFNISTDKEPVKQSRLSAQNKFEKLFTEGFLRNHHLKVFYLQFKTTTKRP